MTVKTLSVRVALIMFVSMASRAAATVIICPPWMTAVTIRWTGMMIEGEGCGRMGKCPSRCRLVAGLTGCPVIRCMARRFCRVAVIEMAGGAAGGYCRMSMRCPSGCRRMTIFTGGRI